MLNSQTKKISSKKKKLLVILFFTFLALVSLIFSIFHTFSIPRHLKALQLSDASTHAQKAIFFPKIINNLTLRSIPSLNIWESGLNQVILGQNLLEEGSLYFSSALQSDLQKSDSPDLPDSPNSQFPQKLDLFNQNLSFFLEQLDKSWLVPKITSAKLISQINQLKTLNSELNTLTDHFLTDQRTYLIVLQNSQEIRATGGFMGSYAKPELDNGAIKTLKIEDIYQPDGQFTGFIEAPPGIKDYLSGGGGLRLPNSNWSPDFPTSAQTILSFFALGEESSVDGLIAINLAAAENMLDVVGDIYLADYDTTITSHNLAEVARADRDQFFPGSQQKPNFLNALLKQFVFRLQKLDPTQKKQIFSQLLAEIPQKNIQFYSNQEKIQNIFHKYNLSGEMSFKLTTNHNLQKPTYLYLVESNVGINKANKKITRNVVIDLSEKKTTITIDFTNHNSLTPPTKHIKSKSPDSATHMDYVNYQRLFILPDVQVEKITFNNEPITNWDEELIVTFGGETFKQIGFLITVPEKNTNTLTIELTSNRPFSLNPTLVIQKQSGLPATPYTIKYRDEVKNILLEKDEVVVF